MLPMKIMHVTLLGLLFLYSCSPNQTEKESFESNPGYSTEIEARIERITNNLQVETAITGAILNKSLDEQMKKYQTPGVSIAVINNGEIEWARGFGKRDLTNGDEVGIQTLFEAGSVIRADCPIAVSAFRRPGPLARRQSSRGRRGAPPGDRHNYGGHGRGRFS